MSDVSTSFSSLSRVDDAQYFIIQFQPTASQIVADEGWKWEKRARIIELVQCLLRQFNFRTFTDVVVQSARYFEAFSPHFRFIFESIIPVTLLMEKFSEILVMIKRLQTSNAICFYFMPQLPRKRLNDYFRRRKKWTLLFMSESFA